MDVAREYRRRLRRESSPIVLLVAIGVGLLIAGLVIVGVVAGRRSPNEPTRTPAVKWGVLSAPSVAPTVGELKAKAVAASRSCIWDQYRLEVAEDALVTRYGSDLYVVTGSLQDAGQTKIYEAKLRWKKDSWKLEVVTVNGQKWYGAEQ